MDVSRYSLKDLLLAALKSEVESEKIYLNLAKAVDNYFLRNRLAFMAGEEKSHAEFFTGLWHERFADEPLKLPQKTAVPLPELSFDAEKIPVSVVLSKAKEAEKAASDFYASMAEHYADDPDDRTDTSVKKMLGYIAQMEMVHYEILEQEEKKAKEFEDFTVYWRQIHEGI